MKLASIAHRAAILTAAAFVAGQAAAQPATAPERPRVELPAWSPPVVQTGSATLVRAYPAPEAGQGAAVDARHIYAIVNSAIGQYDKTSGALVRRWAQARDALIRHINSCFAEGQRLWCANSNFPEIPMASSIEVFDTATLSHVESRSLGLQDEGSLVWFDRLGAGWIAGFAHYDERGGLPFKGSAYASVVTYDAEWRRTGGWMLPASVQERMAPHAASGGAIGPDGLLYVMGHSRPEIYVLAKPRQGPVLLHLATFDIAAEGQAFAWDKTAPRRIAAISRPGREVRVFDLPPVAADHPDVLSFPATGWEPTR